MTKTLLAIAAHPDDLEFGCGGILLLQRELPLDMHWLLCSQGESGTNGSPQQRKKEAEAAAELAGARLHWIDLGGDAQISESRQNANRLAIKIREIQPQMVLAPTPEVHQHPDHLRVSRLTRDAARLARYGGLEPLKAWSPHEIQSLLYYKISAGPCLLRCPGIAFDISPVAKAWKELMACHESQLKTRDYLEYQLERARTLGRECGTQYVQMLYSEEPIMLSSLTDICGSARKF